LVKLCLYSKRYRNFGNKSVEEKLQDFLNRCLTGSINNVNPTLIGAILKYSRARYRTYTTTWSRQNS